MLFHGRRLFSSLSSHGLARISHMGMSHIGVLFYHIILEFVEHLNKQCVHFFNVFLFLAGPEGLGKKKL
jgi:hypothetical protein